MRDKVAAFIKENTLIDPGCTVLAAVSGGADSVALLSILTELREEMRLTLYAAHLNHGIRGAAADADEAYVKTLCANLGVPCLSQWLDIPALARAHSHTLEQEGRIARYAFLEETRASVGASRIAVAHHKDDQAESILMHLVRGSGLAGLTGMQPRRGNIVRPLLCVRRSEIEAYLNQRGIAYCTDATNLVAEGTRNRIRLDVVPYVEKYINPGFTDALCSMAGLLDNDERFLDSMARQALAMARREGGFDRMALCGLAEPVRSRAIRLALTEIGAIVDVERAHIEKIEALLSMRTGAALSLPGAQVRNSYELIIFERARTEAAVSFEIPFIPADGETETPDGIFTASLTLDTAVTADPYTAYMDADKLPDAMLIRRRQPGDRFFPLGAPGTRKLKEYFIDRKTPREGRETPLIASGADVLFIPGFGIADSVKVTEKTARVLRVEYSAQNK